MEMDCYQMQGYLFAKPLPKDEFEQYIDNHFNEK
jgi:EAL domain-containing protein (putative c-di-GMP-specific phosphodiesterase class I)